MAYKTTRTNTKLEKYVCSYKLTVFHYKTLIFFYKHRLLFFFWLQKNTRFGNNLTLPAH